MDVSIPTMTDKNSTSYATFATQVSSATDTDQDLCDQISIVLKSPSYSQHILLTYLTEGAANVIWQIAFSPTSYLHCHNASFVLRMRKDIPSTSPMLKLEQQYNDRIAPLFTSHPEVLLAFRLVRINQTIIDGLNAQLRELEASSQRKEMRRRIYHPPFTVEPYAMVLPNLAQGSGILIEFKPKWLVQSPSAPQDAQRCRTCALNTTRRSKKQEVGRGDSGFCPFQLLSIDDHILTRALGLLWTDPETLRSFVESFKAKVQSSLLYLQKVQIQENAVGLDDFQNPQGKDFSVAMALRDCSALLKVDVSVEDDGSGDQIVNISTLKFLDLDLKQAGGGKVEKWAQTELDLIEGGWYTLQSQKQSDVQCFWRSVGTIESPSVA